MSGKSAARCHRDGSEAGQASVELVAILPALILCVVVAAHALPSGWALWSAADAARIGARAEHVGKAGEEAARDALPTPLRPPAPGRADGRAKDLPVESGERGVSVQVEVPGLLPGFEGEPIGAAARLEAEAPEPEP